MSFLPKNTITNEQMSQQGNRRWPCYCRSDRRCRFFLWLPRTITWHMTELALQRNAYHGARQPAVMTGSGIAGARFQFACSGFDRSQRPRTCTSRARCTHILTRERMSLHGMQRRLNIQQRGGWNARTVAVVGNWSRQIQDLLECKDCGCFFNWSRRIQG